LHSFPTRRSSDLVSSSRDITFKWVPITNLFCFIPFINDQQTHVVSSHTWRNWQPLHYRFRKQSLPMQDTGEKRITSMPLGQKKSHDLSFLFFMGTIYKNKHAHI